MNTSQREARASGHRLMGVWAHPDDESFGMSGTMARVSQHGGEAAIVCATRGEVGEIAEGTGATPETLGKIREHELREACEAVGVTDVSFLDYIDGQVADADTDEAIGRIVYHLRRFRPHVVVTFAPNGGYGHVDHMAISRLTLAALRAAAEPTRYPQQIAQGLAPHTVSKLYFTAMPRESMLEMREQARAQGQDFIPGGNAATLPVEEMGTPQADITTYVTLTDEEFAAKQRSMQAHATQMPADSPFARMPPDLMRRWMGTEPFQLVPEFSDKPYPTPETDIFAGLE